VTVFGLGAFIGWRWYNTASDLHAYAGINQSASFRVGQTFYFGSDVQPKSPASATACWTSIG
jgi:hypothetical protein